MLSGGIPSAITYQRVFSIISPEQLENICVLFTQDVLKLFSSKSLRIINIVSLTANDRREKMLEF